MFHVPEDRRIVRPPLASSPEDGNNGAFLLECMVDARRRLLAVASDGEGWEHVSVSVQVRKIATPTWGEMHWVKGLFWDPEDCVVEFHPPESDYVNCHPGCLHLWRRVDEEFPRPPAWMVGPKT